MKQDRNAYIGWLKRFGRCASGAILVEFALVVPVLVVLALGAADFGRGFQEKLRLQSAAEAGAHYALQNADNPDDEAAVEQSARDDAEDTAEALAIAARYYCTCPSTGEVTCGDPCPGTEIQRSYIEVEVQNDLDLLFRYTGVAETLPISAKSSMRIR